MTSLRTPAEIAFLVFGKTSAREIRNCVESLRRKAVRYIETDGREGIPFKAIGRKRFYYLEYFELLKTVQPPERIAAWLR